MVSHGQPINNAYKIKSIILIDSSALNLKLIIDKDQVQQDNCFKPVQHLQKCDSQTEQNKGVKLLELKVKLRHGESTKTEEERFIEIDQSLYYVASVDDEPNPRLYVPGLLAKLIVTQYHEENIQAVRVRFIQSNE